ncbi:MAG: fatty acid cis/trans isomerase [Methyloprofundus sp.]|nr:fatty acid cis/trans isomerase [Methyloprofundus sp.]
MKKIVIWCSFIVFIAACTSPYHVKDYQQLYGSSQPKDRTISQLAPEQISYSKQVKKILDSRCIACHACYDAPCQLKLSSFTGLERGGSQQAVYDGARLTVASPTRLFIDAKNTQEWRDKDFFPVLNERQESAVANIDNSVLAQMLLQKRRFPLSAQSKPEENQYRFDPNEKFECPNINEYADFANKHPQWGMPYALPGLNLSQEHTILTWLEQGAKNDQKFKLSTAAKQAIKQWENFFNVSSLKQQLVSRYIYEHLFIGHIHFKDHPDNEFYRLVRSKTPPGQAIEEISTVRPYDDPQLGPFYYRLQPILHTIVDKTHFIYELSPQRRQRYEQLFFANQFAVTQLPSYSPEAGANPLHTFTAIPNPIKYQFLLDDAQYFVSGFIKGPVCRGQLALNVIQDHFWVLFFNPVHPYQDIANKYYSENNKILYLPGKDGDQISLMGWTDYDAYAKDYLNKKSQFLQETFQNDGGFTLDNIWKGDGWNQNAALTIFRHFDSATVEQGLIGDAPKTAWVLDYPLFERIHYLLVAGFNVYGSAGHQLASRTYMDFLRRDGEYNFLRFLPPNERLAIYNDWYQGLLNGRIKADLLNLEFKTAVQFTQTDTKADFFKQAKTYLGKALAPSRWAKECPQEACINYTDQVMRQLEQLKGIQISALPELAFLRVKMQHSPDRVYSLMRNKGLSNVAYILAEAYRAVPEKDTLTVVPGFIGSYPNFFFSVAEQDLDKFISALSNAQSKESQTDFYAQFGIRRNNPKIWETLDWFNTEHKKLRGLEAGLFDMNRYQNL